MSAWRVATPHPAPSRVVSIDLDGPWEDQIDAIVREPGHSRALVIGWHGQAPVGSIHVDLSDVVELLGQLRSLATAAVPARDLRTVTRDELPSISVVVSTLGERPRDLELLLDGFAAMDYPRAEFILVDNRERVSEADPLATLEITRPWLRVVRESRPGASAGRNAGIAAAENEIIAFTDDDVRIDRRWLQSIGQRFALDPHVEVVTGLILPAELDTAAQIWFERYYGGFSGTRVFEPRTVEAESRGLGRVHGSRVTARDATGKKLKEFAIYGLGAYGAGANMAFRRTSITRVGGFDVSLGAGTLARGGEDLAALISVLWTGGVLAYEPGAVAHHRHRRGVDELLNQLGGYGLGFTAMLCSLVLGDPRHLVALGAQLPGAVREVAKQGYTRLVTAVSREPATPGSGAVAETYPRILALHELRQYPCGPIAYARSLRATKAWT